MTTRFLSAALPALALVVAAPAQATRAADVPALGGSGAVETISSDTPGALDAPSDWRCDKIRPDYLAWIARGNSAQSWRFVGKTYRVASSGELYTWDDWLSWARKEGCGGKTSSPPGQGAATGAAAGGGVSKGLLYGGGGLLLVGLLLAGMGGGGADSPG